MRLTMLESNAGSNARPWTSVFSSIGSAMRRCVPFLLRKVEKLKIPDYTQEIQEKKERAGSLLRVAAVVVAVVAAVFAGLFITVGVGILIGAFTWIFVSKITTLIAEKIIDYQYSKKTH